MSARGSEERPAAVAASAVSRLADALRTSALSRGGLEKLPLLEPWAPGPHPAYLRIEPESVSGRRFVIGSIAASQEMSRA